MNETSLLELLEEVATRLGVELRYENLASVGIRSDGGFCKVAGRSIILINRKDSRRRQIQILARSLNKLNLDGIFIPPAVRKMIEANDN